MVLCVSPPGFRLQVFNLGNSEVDGVVRRFKHAEHHVDDLEGHLEASSFPKLDPQFITRDTTFMPGETVYPVYSMMCTFIYLCTCMWYSLPCDVVVVH